MDRGQYFEVEHCIGIGNCVNWMSGRPHCSKQRLCIYFYTLQTLEVRNQSWYSCWTRWWGITLEVFVIPQDLVQWVLYIGNELMWWWSRGNFDVPSSRKVSKWDDLMDPLFYHGALKHWCDIQPNLRLTRKGDFWLCSDETKRGQLAKWAGDDFYRIATCNKTWAP